MTVLNILILPCKRATFRVSWDSSHDQVMQKAYWKIPLLIQGYALADSSGPWHLTFALGQTENLSACILRVQTLDGSKQSFSGLHSPGQLYFT